MFTSKVHTKDCPKCGHHSTKVIAHFCNKCGTSLIIEISGDNKCSNEECNNKALGKLRLLDKTDEYCNYCGSESILKQQGFFDN